MDIIKVLVIFTCFNRKEKTEACIKRLVHGNPYCKFTFIAIDDNSIDGTAETLVTMKNRYDIHILHGDGNLYYSRGMRYGMMYAIKNLKKEYEYLLLINDDVEFYDNVIDMMIKQSTNQCNSVVVGALQGRAGDLTYSGIKYVRGIHYRKVPISEWETVIDTFNANCVLIPYEQFLCTGVIDEKYIHSLGDFDYGLMLKRCGSKIHVSWDYVGICECNSIKGTWQDCNLKRMERLKRKENIKGAPVKQWSYFLKKNFGIITMLKCALSPYIRIFLKK